MKLGRFSISDLAEVLEKIEGCGVEVETFKFGDHKVMLNWSNGNAFVVGITLGEWAKGYNSGGPVTRGSGIPGDAAGNASHLSGHRR